MLGYVCVALVSVILAILYLPPDWTSDSDDHRDEVSSSLLPPDRLLSRDELSQYSGEEGSKGLYLAVLGQVFDVDKGRKNYGPGGGYHSLAGKDASLSFITGDFTESRLTDDVSSLSPLQVVALYDWLAFYWKNYHPVGRLVGRFYSESGTPTEALLGVRASLAEGLKLKAQTRAESERYPACNAEWSADRGRVWCSTKSGGVKRDWAGVPRKLFSPGSSRARCVCVEDQQTAAKDPNLQEYEDCPLHADACPVVD